jgi:hypothetical protein
MNGPKPAKFGCYKFELKKISGIGVTSVLLLQAFASII